VTITVASTHRAYLPD